MEIKQEITNIVNILPEDILKDILLYLRQIENIAKEKSQLSINLNTILKEDREVLEKLAK